MNYGYAELDASAQPLRLDNADEKERYCLQLYDQVAGAAPLKDLEVLEVGCGRGGGASYMMRYLKPMSLTAIDFSRRNINMCQRRYSLPGLTFQMGDAEALQFKPESFDAVVNVESSHCYSNEERFFSEAFRVLRCGGHFLFADFRPAEQVALMEDRLRNVGFAFIEKKVINPNVAQALALDHERRLEVLSTYKEPIFQRYFSDSSKTFSGNKDTPIYDDIKANRLTYFRYVLRKP
jgi:ubiquinone/menaquinone biosynthesis C-methylase UbiE